MTTSTASTATAPTADTCASNERCGSAWWQWNIEFTDWSSAEQVASGYLEPLLRDAEQQGVLGAWWFMRKHPCWRLRLQAEGSRRELESTVRAGLEALVGTGRIARWWPAVYEPETAAFGGDPGMDAAHAWFAADSRAILQVLSAGPAGRGAGDLGRRELSMLLCTAMFHAAGLEWYEQGDVWHRVTLERPPADDLPAGRVTALAGDLRQLLLTDTTPAAPGFAANGPLAGHAGWIDAARAAGRALGAAARDGRLDRGLRHILSYHVLFHWNRLGLSARTQSVLARAARAAVLDLPVTVLQPPPPMPPSARQVGRDGRRPGHAIADEAASPPGCQVRTHGSHASGPRTLFARFPLVHRARFRCADLSTRVGDIRHFGTAAHHARRVEDRVDRACAAWNLAALLAADCALPGLATDWCQAQFAILHAAWPLPGRAAIAALQPLVNLARLHARAGRAEQGHQELIALHQAVSHGGGTSIGDLAVEFDGFVASPQDRADVDTWLRTTLCEDGTRLLASTGDWARASAHAARYDNAPEQLREARQTLAISRAVEGQIDDAHRLINTSIVSGVEERALATVLLASTQPATIDPATVHNLLLDMQAALAVAATPTALFRVRLGLAAVDTITTTTDAHAEACQPVLEAIAQHAEQSGDALAAREVLRHPASAAWLAADQHAALTGLVHSAGLGCASALTPHLTELTTVLDQAATTLAEALHKIHQRDQSGVAGASPTA